MILVGITGGMCSGKTTVAQLFRELGADVIDADKIAYKVLGSPEVRKKLVALFGKEIVTRKRVDRKKLSEIVFRSREQIDRLNRIVHPGTKRRILRQALQSRKKVVIIDAPLLIESGLYKKMHKVIVIKTKRALLMRRCLKKGFREHNVRSRLKYQMPLSRKLNFADFILDNNGPLSEIRQKVVRIWKKFVDN